MDIVEQLRSESVDLRINPVGMRRVLFRLKTDYGKVLRKEEKRRQQLLKAASIVAANSD